MLRVHFDVLKPAEALVHHGLPQVQAVLSDGVAGELLLVKVQAHYIVLLVVWH